MEAPQTLDDTGSQPLLHLAYASTMPPETLPELPAIVAASAQRNAALGITGCLSENAGTIVQILQGPADAVVTLYERILRDERHRGVIELIRLDIERPTMRDWSMVRWPIHEVYARVHP